MSVKANAFVQLVDIAALELDPTAELLRVALRLRRAGVQVENPSLAEIEALGAAGDQIADEQALMLVMKLRDFALAIKPYDGGEAVTNEVLDVMEARYVARRAAQNGRA